MKLKKICIYLLIASMSVFFLVGCDSVKGGKDKSDDNGGWSYDGADDYEDDDNGGEIKKITVKKTIDDVLNAYGYTFKIESETYCKYEDGNLYLKFDSLNGNRSKRLEIYYLIYGGKYYYITVENGRTDVTEVSEAHYFYYINREKLRLLEEARYTIEIYMRCLSNNIKAFADDDGYGEYVLKTGALSIADAKLSYMKLSADDNGLKIKATCAKKTYNAEFTDINKTVIKIPQNVLSEIN